ncbi:hypothetical protein [Clostridium omnivorum]|uniref:Uncharacterized protein n=1 Tax=Clostridium omnivorum TaxID=1604902 RepID=A0ABQ5N155_9CLOT|nr:hypothetical protein [Clostridium sp. E14]GLC28925.1 hypothetical protein bsdE14_03350 [Clostridium sp. E14]
MASKLSLELKNILGKGAFSEIGHPTGFYWNRDRTRFAIASSFGYIQWSARGMTTRMRLRYRVSIYETKNIKRLAVLDDLHYPINDIAFHQHLNLVAIATGCYDGGYFFEGDLVAWDYKDNKHRSLLQESREVVKCSFEDEGDTLSFIIKPATEEDEDGNSIEDKLYGYKTNKYLEGKIILEESAEITLDEAKDYEKVAIMNALEIEKLLKTLALENNNYYEERMLIWDLIWRNSDEIICTGSKFALELWNTRGEKKLHIDEVENGVQLFMVPNGEKVLINVNNYNNLLDMKLSQGSSIHEVEIESRKLTKRVSKDYPLSLSLSSEGYFLARNCDCMRSKKKSVASDFILDNNLNQIESYYFGYYDFINNYIQINGKPELFFIQGTPKESHENQWVCTINPITKIIRRLFPLEWNEKRNYHLFSDGGCYCEDELGEALVLATRIYNGRGNGDTILMRRDLKKGNLTWEAIFKSQITALVFSKEHSSIIFALSEGKIGAISSINGLIEFMDEVTIDGVPSVIMSLSYYNGNIAGGTVDGMIMHYKI